VAGLFVFYSEKLKDFDIEQVTIFSKTPSLQKR